MKKQIRDLCFRTSNRLGLSFITIAMIGAGLIYGQAEEPLETESDYILPEIVITATKSSQTLHQVPLSTTLVSREFIDMMPASDVADVLQFQTGTTVRRNTQGGMSTISLRGASAAQVLITRDGIPINDPFNGTADLSLLGLSSIEKIEIVRGPTSHLYGANALGGVINLITREVANAREITLSQGSYNTQALSLHAGFGSLKGGASLSADLNRSDGWRGNDDFIHRRVTSTAATSIGGVSITLTTGYSDGDVGVPGPKPAYTPLFGNEEVSSLYDRQTNQNMYAVVAVETRPWETATLEFQTRPEWNTTRFLQEYADFFSQEFRYDENEYRARNLRTSGQLEMLMGSQRILGGFELIDDAGSVEQTTQDTTGAILYSSDWEPHAREWALWGEFISEWAQLSVVGGLRLDVHSVYGQHLSPCLGIVLQMNHQILKFSLGGAYRAPSHNDLFWPLLGNPDLNPERGLTTELSYEYHVRPNIRGKGSIFHRGVQDMIAWLPSGATGLWLPQNINRFNLIGMELELTAQRSDWIMTLAYTFLDGEQVNREHTYFDTTTSVYQMSDVRRPAAFVPAHTISHQLGWVKPRFRISLSTNWRSKIRNTYEDWTQWPTITRNVKKLSARTVVNGKLVFLIGNLQPYLSVRNLLDEDYSDQFGTDFYDQDFPMPRRTFEVGLRLKL